MAASSLEYKCHILYDLYVTNLASVHLQIKCRIADRIAEDTWMIPSEADIMDALGEGCSTAMPRWKRWALQAAAFGVNYLQVGTRSFWATTVIIF